MENVKLDTFFTPVSERAKTPFYSSFLISWIFINWKIIYVTLFFDKDDLRGFDIINYLIHVRYINSYDNFFWPLLSALGYIFLYPWLDRVFFNYTELRKREKLDDKIKIGRKFSVDGNKYWDLHKELEDTLDRFNRINENNIELNTTLIEKDREVFNLTSQMNEVKRGAETSHANWEKLRARNDINKFFQEPWQFSIEKGGTIEPFTNNVFYEVRNNEVVRHLDNEAVASILFFEQDHFLNRLKMLLNIKGTERLVFLDLYMDSGNIFNGMLNKKRVSITKGMNSEA